MSSCAKESGKLAASSVADFSWKTYWKACLYWYIVLYSPMPSVLLCYSYFENGFTFLDVSVLVYYFSLFWHKKNERMALYWLMKVYNQDSWYEQIDCFKLISGCMLSVCECVVFVRSFILKWIPMMYKDGCVGKIRRIQNHCKWNCDFWSNTK